MDIFLAVNAKDVRKIIRAIQQLSDNPVIKNFRELETDLNEFVQNFSVETIHKNEMSTILLQLKDIIVLHGIKVPTHFFLLARSMVIIEGVLMQLDPDIDLAKLVRPYLIRSIARQYDPVQFTKRILNSIYEMGMYMEEFPRDLKNAIRRINDGEVKVDLRHKGIDPLVHTINRISKQVISAVIVAALIVGSSLMIIHNVTPLWGHTSTMGIIGLIIAGITAFNILRDLKKGDHDEWQGWSD